MQSKIINHLESLNKELNVAEYMDHFFEYGESNSSDDFEVKLFYCYAMSIRPSLKDKDFNKRKKALKDLYDKGELKDFYFNRVKPNFEDKDFKEESTAYRTISILSTWLEFKQIYKFDNDAYKMILDTEPKDITYEELKALKMPYNSFGVENELYFRGYHVDSFLIDRYYNESDNSIDLGVTLFLDNPSGTANINAHLEEGDTLLDSCPEDFLENIKKVINIIMYLSQPKIDIIKKSVIKRKSDKKDIPKHFYNIEYNHDEVGCELGSAIRKYRYIYESKNENKDDSNEHQKRIVRPHIRCGHFQGYWIGKGRTEYVTKYIKPIFVLGGSKNATIHNVK